jgi:hypothetical protein
MLDRLQERQPDGGEIPHLLDGSGRWDRHSQGRGDYEYDANSPYAPQGPHMLKLSRISFSGKFVGLVLFTVIVAGSAGFSSAY